MHRCSSRAVVTLPRPTNGGQLLAYVDGEGGCSLRAQLPRGSFYAPRPRGFTCCLRNTTNRLAAKLNAVPATTPRTAAV
jgi:hypothetical protein